MSYLPDKILTWYNKTAIFVIDCLLATIYLGDVPIFGLQSQQIFFWTIFISTIFLLVREPKRFLVPLNGTSQTIYFCKAEYPWGMKPWSGQLNSVKAAMASCLNRGFRRPRHLGLQRYVWLLVLPGGTNNTKSGHGLIDYIAGWPDPKKRLIKL